MPVNQEIEEIIYTDFDFKFKAHPITKDVPLLSNTESIKRSVKNLVLSNKYDHPYNPSVYANILYSLFENFDPILVLDLKDKIRQVMQFEPRVVLNDILISDYNALDRNGINITIIYTPLNERKTTTVEIFLQRVR